MDFKSLHYVLAVARTKSISKAAQELGISQPSLTHVVEFGQP
ncbi:MAG: LysR family transcriptional regulator [Christensenellales bacterium]